MSNEIHPVRSVRIEGAIARGTARVERPVAAPRNVGPIDVTPKFRVVKDALDADKEIGNPGDQHNCPLCGEFFGWEAFKAHANPCIEARFPRERIWLPAGMVNNPIQSYADTIKGGK